MNFYPRTPAGCDNQTGIIDTDYRGISIRAPLRGATIDVPDRQEHFEFLSTHPCGVRLLRQKSYCCRCYFYPRTPAGCDRNGFYNTDNSTDFYPRTPAGCD